MNAIKIMNYQGKKIIFEKENSYLSSYNKKLIENYIRNQLQENIFTDQISMEGFRERIDIPNSYRMTHINQKVLTPIIKELGSIFNNLNINKIKAKKS